MMRLYFVQKTLPPRGEKYAYVIALERGGISLLTLLIFFQNWNFHLGGTNHVLTETEERNSSKYVARCSSIHSDKAQPDHLAQVRV